MLYFFFSYFLLDQKVSKKSRQNMLPPALGNPVIDSQSSTSPFAVNYHDCPFTLAQCAHFVGATALLGRCVFWQYHSVWWP
jgi:hypothetical protein